MIKKLRSTTFFMLNRVILRNIVRQLIRKQQRKICCWSKQSRLGCRTLFIATPLTKGVAMSQQQKPWYKKPLGMVVAVLLLPFFLIWYAWTKSNWSKNVRIGVTVASVLLVVIALATTPKTEQTAQKPAQNTPQAEQKKEEPKPKADDSELNAEVKIATDIPGIEITNKEKVNWDECEIKLNNDYSRTIRNPLTPNEPLNNPYGLFTKGDGTRFDITETAIKDVFIKCKVNDHTRYGYYKFN